MGPIIISASVLLLRAAAAALTMVVTASPLLSAAAAAAALPPAPAPIGMPGCNTICGDVSVPYPFGFGDSGCYWPGLNLTCDTSHSPPRLLLGDGSLRVAEISLSNLTVRVMRAAGYVIDDTTGNSSSTADGGWSATLDLGRGFRENGYLLLSARNELVVTGCNVMATFSADMVGQHNSRSKVIGGCASFCTMVDRGDGSLVLDDSGGEGKYYCTGTSGCCLAPLASSGVPVPNGVQARWVYIRNNHNMEPTPVTVLVAEQGWWVDRQQQAGGVQFRSEEAPILLDFAVKQQLPQPNSNSSECPPEVERMVCKSEHSSCFVVDQGYACRCDGGYDGNPYLPGGCQA